VKQITVIADPHISERYNLSEICRLLNDVSIIANQTDELWVLGDVFDTKHPTSKEYSILITFLLSIKVPVIIIVGNHDQVRQTHSTLDWLPLIFKQITILNQAQILDLEGLKILIGHYNIRESVMGAYDYSIKSDVGLTDLDQQKIDLALLGHIHKFQVLKGAYTTVIHPGSLYYLDFGERLDQKYVVKLILDSQKYKVEYINLNPSKMYQFEVSSDKIDLTPMKQIEPTSRVKIIVHYSNPSLNKIKINQLFRAIQCQDMKIIYHYLPAELPEITKSQRISGDKDLLREFYQVFHINPKIIKLIEENLSEDSSL